MINEPTYWSANCDLWNCKNTWEPYDYNIDSIEEAEKDMRSSGWIVIASFFDTFCSLDHFMAYRTSSMFGAEHRKQHSEAARHHANLRHDGQYCCHGYHATNHPNGVGHEYDCIEYREAFYALRKERLNQEAEAKAAAIKAGAQ